MVHIIEIFTMGKSSKAKVGCSSCPNACSSRDQVELTPEMLSNQLQALFAENIKAIIHDYSEGDQEAILMRQNELYKSNGINRRVNKVLIGPLSQNIWPSVIIDDDIKSEGVLLDATRIKALLEVI